MIRSFSVALHPAYLLCVLGHYVHLFIMKYSWWMEVRVRSHESWRLKTRDWKTRHQTAGVENEGVEKYEKPEVPVI